MNSFDIIKIIHGSSLSAGNTFKKETTSHNTEYIEAFALNQEMKYLSEAYALSGEEKSLIQVCMQLYNLLQNESISVDRRVSILHSLSLSAGNSSCSHVWIPECACSLELFDCLLILFGSCN